MKIVSSIQFLARQGPALRGHDDNKGNFVQLLRLRQNDSPDLLNWLTRKTSWTSPLIQNEILDLLGITIVRNLATILRSRQYFAMIVDGSRDCSGQEQESICIRTVDNDLTVHEDFVGFYKMTTTTGGAIANMIKDVLVRLQLPMSFLRGQTFDGASNMSGCCNGAQAVVCQSQPLAVFIHCGAHCSNLAMKAV